MKKLSLYIITIFITLLVSSCSTTSSKDSSKIMVECTRLSEFEWVISYQLPARFKQVEILSLKSFKEKSVLTPGMSFVTRTNKAIVKTNYSTFFDSFKVKVRFPKNAIHHSKHYQMNADKTVILSTDFFKIAVTSRKGIKSSSIKMINKYGKQVTSFSPQEKNSKKETLDEKRLELEEYFKEIVKNNMNDVLSQNLVGKQLNDI